MGCTFRAGPDVLKDRYRAIFANKSEGIHMYAADNDFQFFGGKVDPWGIRATGGKNFFVGHREPMAGNPKKLERPVPCAPVTTQSSEEAYKLVLAQAGAWPRDATTRRVVREAEAQTGQRGLNGPYERFAAREDGPTSAKFDTDRDGMPDAWEKAHGLNPADPADGNKTAPKGASEGDRHAGYTYVEYYLNELADAIVGVDGLLCKVKAGVEGNGLIACEHSGKTPKWDARSDELRGGAKEVAWGEQNVFQKGSTVALKAVPKTSLQVNAPDESRFSHWSAPAGVRHEGGDVNGAKDPLIKVIVDRDMTITAHFVEK